MKKIFFAILLLNLFLFAGCASEEPPAEVVLKGENSVDITVLTAEPNYAVGEMAAAFGEKLSEYTGKTVEVKNMETADPDESGYCIYVDTVREDGTNLPDFNYYADVAEVGAVTWVDAAIKTYEENYELIYGETSAQIIAPDEYALYFALEDFLKAFENETLTVPAGTRVLKGTESLPTPDQLIDTVGDVKFLFTEHKITFVYHAYEVSNGKVLSVDGTRRDGMQGGGTDGKYAYYALYEDDIANIYKFDLADWSLVAVSEALPTGHSNDITYVPEQDVLMIADCTEKDGWAGVHYVDPHTLEYVKYDILPFGCRGLQYVPSTEQYVITGSYTHNVYDKNFNLLKTINCGFPYDTTQGLYCDGSYIYDARWGDEDGTGQNYLLVHDMDGNFISHGIIYGDPHPNGSENENVFIHENFFYVGYYNTPRTINEYVMVPAELFG